MDLALPLRVGHLRASVLCSDRKELKEQLMEGYGGRASLQGQRPA